MLTKRKKYKLNNKVLAKMFEYASENSYKNSTAKRRIERAIDRLIKHVEDSIISGITE